MRNVTIEPFSDEAFAQFGRAIRHRGTAPLLDLPSVFDRTPEAVEPYCGLLRVDAAIALPHVVTRLERHPFSAQSFFPLVDGGCIAIVCPSGTDETPLLEGLRAFLIAPGCGITYNRNVWHHSMLASSAPSQWSALMHKTGRGDDNVFWTPDAPIHVIDCSAA